MELFTFTNPVLRSKFRCKLFIFPKSANLSYTSSSCVSSCKEKTNKIQPPTAKKQILITKN